MICSVAFCHQYFYNEGWTDWTGFIIFMCAACPADFTHVSHGCYKVVVSNLTWIAAAKKCRSLHEDAHLIVINNQEEQDAIPGMVGFGQ